MNANKIKIKKETKNATKVVKISKKWKEFEILKILDYLEDNRNFELPTAQIYYKQFLEESKIEATWDIVRWKVRYLKTCFGKAETWRNNTGAGILEEDVVNGINTVDDKLRKICAHYDRLKDIFGEKRSAETSMFDSSMNSGDFFGFMELEEIPEIVDDVPQVILQTPLENIETNEPQVNLDNISSQSSINLDNFSGQSSSMTQKVSAFAEKLKKSAPKDSISQLTKCQMERNDTQRLKIKFEEDKFEKELEFQKEKFQSELEIRRQELELKKREIEKDEKIKMLEIEKNERLAKYELELKYKIQ